MHVNVRKAGDVVIVDLDGKLTMGLGDQILRDTIDELLAEGWKTEDQETGHEAQDSCTNQTCRS